MKLTTAILATVCMAGAAWGQNPDAIDNARSVAKSLQQIKTNQTNEALAASGTPTAPSGTQTAAKPATPAAATAKNAATTKSAATTKPHDAFTPKKPVKTAKASTKIAAEPEKPEAAKAADAQKPAAKPEAKKWALTGKRDPFFSPVVSQVGGSGCATGKKCLEIGQINLRGVVKSESGFIAVVTNSLNKAYFLHENDPVFNGYVVRITGDSVVFSETVQDKLGKAFTREVVKKVSAPAV